MKKTIICLSGFKGSGKDLCADYLIKNYGYIRVSFADSLKDLTAEQYDIPRYFFDSNAYKEAPLLHLPISPKDNFGELIYQYLCKEFSDECGNKPYFYCAADGKFIYKTDKTCSGYEDRITYWTPRALLILEGGTKRSVAPNFWVDRVIEQIDRLDKVVLTDLRYKSEIVRFKEVFENKATLYLTRVRRYDTVESTTSSERDLDDYKFDYYLNNKGDKTQFYKHLDWFMEVLTEKENT